MKKRKGNLVLLLLFLMVSSVLSSCSIEEVEVKSFEGVDISKLEDQEGNVTFDLIISNPNWVKVKLNEMDLKIGVNNHHIGTATLLEKTEIPANGDYLVKLKMHLVIEKSITQIATNLGLAVLTGNIELNLTGNAKGALGFFPQSMAISHSEKISWDDLKKFAI